MMPKIITDRNIYDEDGNIVTKKNQLCKCGHSASNHVQLFLHPMNPYACVTGSCKCKAFVFDRIREK